MKILHIITDLSTARAEVMLTKPLSGIDETAFKSEFIPLTGMTMLIEI